MDEAKILLVDDVKLIVELEKSFLRYTPVRILTAANGEEALAVIRQEMPQLVVLDLHMPRMDGAACCRQMKADPQLQKIPVVMVTNAGRSEDESLCRAAGCDDFITKPLDRREFLAKGRYFLPQVDRREPRAACEVPISYLKDGMPGVGKSVDMSAGGLYMASENRIPAESILALSFALPGAETKPIMARGRVAWSNDHGNGECSKPHLPTGVGIEFLDVPETVRESIRLFVAIRQGR
jgi:CheY-like chemotaxis protein